MRIRLTQLTVGVDYTDDDVRRAVAGRLGVGVEAVVACEVVRRSIDARAMRQSVCFILRVEVRIDDTQVETEKVLPALQGRRGVEVLSESPDAADAGPAGALAGPLRFSGGHRHVVVGAGPAGLLAAWRLARAGARPVLVERGAPVEERRTSVGRFWAGGGLDPEDNVLYGEGGAGLFSDGKLTTRTKLRGHLRTVLNLLVECGAPESILVDAEPHVGSDRLADVVPRLRERIRALGGEVRFHSRLDALDVRDGQLAAVVVNGERIEADHCILATGHSARDVYAMLNRSQVALAAKPFAVGVRIDVPQQQIDRSQFGPLAGHPRLGAASFRLTRRGGGARRACYTFCMCPGGSVIACASSPGMMTTNGMSLADRAGAYGNAAFLVPATPADYGASPGDPLAGIAWQGEIEAKAFAAGGADYSLPAATLGDFLAGETSTGLPDDRSCRRSVPADLHSILPPYVTDTLVRSIAPMLRRLGKVRVEDAVVYAAETRSSSPVRIVRDEQFQSTSTRGLLPAGEGAGYAGGIVTSAIDGLRAAEAVLTSTG